MAEKFTDSLKLFKWAQPLSSVNETSATNEIGARFTSVDDSYGVKVYVYVLAGSNIAANEVVVYTDAYSTTVSTTHTNNLNRPAGVGIGTITSGNYGFIQARGYYATVTTNGDDDIADDVTLICSGSGACDSVAAGTASTYQPLGITVAADVDASNIVAAYLLC